MDFLRLAWNKIAWFYRVDNFLVAMLITLFGGGGLTIFLILSTVEPTTTLEYCSTDAEKLEEKLREGYHYDVGDNRVTCLHKHVKKSSLEKKEK